MAFYHKDGFTPAWQLARIFTGKEGRIATVPDIIAARLQTDDKSATWNTYFTTISAEYLGFSRIDGRRILIVAHGVGPMSTLEGIQKAYSWEYKDKGRDHRGGRITQQEFWDLEAGKYGEVSIIEFEPYLKRYHYAFCEGLKFSQALDDPLVLARLGPHAKGYLERHARMARQWHREMATLQPENKYNVPEELFQSGLKQRQMQHTRDGKEDSDPFIMRLSDASNCCYTYDETLGHRPIEEGFALAHLLTVNRLYSTYFEGDACLITEISCHEWSNGVRLVGIQGGGDISSGIHPGPDSYRYLHKYWQELLLPTHKSIGVGLRALMQIGEQWFTQYPKQGECLDTGEPEYVVTEMENISRPCLLRTPVIGYHGLFNYGISEVRLLAPPNANAYYFVGEPAIEYTNGEPTYHTAMIRFCHVKLDTSKRVMREDKLAQDFGLLMNLTNIEIA